MPNRAAALPVSFLSRWYAKPILLLVSVILLTLSFAPCNQFYLAWVGLVPWLFVVRQSKSKWRAFFWSWLGGTIFFIANMWWMAYVTIPGMIGLLIYLGIYWGCAALILRALGWIGPDPSATPSAKEKLAIIFGIAAAWVATEWIRGTFCTGLPWLYLGHTQSPVLVMCQIADVVGVYGISFWVVAINVVVYFILIGDRHRWTAATALLILLVLVLGYGLLRAYQTPHKLKPGPRVLVVQPNFPQDNGNKGASESEMLNFHLDATAKAVREKGPIDVVCWSETMVPPLNDEFLAALSTTPEPGETSSPRDHYMHVVEQIHLLALHSKVNIVAGGLYYANVEIKNGKGGFADRRNTAYLFRTDGELNADHYDKIHLVPFGEFVPFRGSSWFGWLHAFFMKLSPYDYDYTLTPGSEDAPTVFRLNMQGVPGARIITPICFEDIDSGLCAKLFRSAEGKRADIIMNLTNDGWFKANENAQHLQAAIFRSIENRVPTARAVNTGISGFIDSYGHVTATVRVRTEGVAVQKLMLDSRYTLYTRVGDLFAWVCTLITGLLVVSAMLHYYSRRQSTASAE